MPTAGAENLHPTRPPTFPPRDRPRPPPPRRDTIAGPIPPDLDVRNLSPRQMAEMSMDLHMVGLITWEERLAFERKHNAGNADLVEGSRRIVNGLRHIAAPLDIVV